MSDDRSPDELRALAIELICALEDSHLGERTRRIGVEMVRRSYGEGRTRVEIVRQADLGTLTNVPDTHIKEGINKLIEHKIVQGYPGTDFYEVLGKPHEWKVGARCRLGFDGAADLRADIDRHNGPPEQQIDFDEKEDTFATDLVRRTIGEISREAAARAARRDTTISGGPRSHRSLQPGEDRERLHTHPPGIIGAEGGAAGERISFLEAARRSLQGEKVTGAVTFADGTVLHSTQPTVPTSAEVTGEVTLPGTRAENQRPKVTGAVTFGSAAGQKLPEREVSSRARPSDDHLSLNHLSKPSEQLSSESDDQGDEGRGDERCGAGKWQMVPLTDDLFGDLRRALGDSMGSFTVDWRRAIFHARPCVAEALASVKLNRLLIKKHPGGYLRTCFLNECRDRGVRLPSDLFESRKAKR